MAHWRKVLDSLGPFADRLRPRRTAEAEAKEVKQPDAVDPGEIALLLLKNAVRLLDQSPAPPEVRAHLQAAIKQLEEFVSARPQ